VPGTVGRIHKIHELWISFFCDTDIWTQDLKFARQGGALLHPQPLNYEFQPTPLGSTIHLLPHLSEGLSVRSHCPCPLTSPSSSTGLFPLSTCLMVQWQVAATALQCLNSHKLRAVWHISWGESGSILLSCWLSGRERPRRDLLPPLVHRTFTYLLGSISGFPAILLGLNKIPTLTWWTAVTGHQMSCLNSVNTWEETLNKVSVLGYHLYLG
jgi:hypothetical protein